MCGRSPVRASVRQSIPAAIFHQLQLKEGLVHHLAAHLNSQLGSDQRLSMGSAVWRRSGKNHETRIPTGVYYNPVLWQRGPSPRGFVLDHAIATCFAVSQVVQGDGADDAREKTGSAAARATSKKLNARSECPGNR